MKEERKAVRFINKLRNLIFPQNETCDICGEELHFVSRYNLCSKCAATLERVEGKVCQKCGVPINNEADYCLRCSDYERLFDFNRSALIYDGIAKKVILSFKFGDKRYLKRLLARLMADKFLEQNYDVDVITYVPMSKLEFKKRGYNQSKLLAEELAKILKMEVVDALNKIKDTTTQKNLTAMERAENLKGAFVGDKNVVSGKKILLIDDVFTTGATANECAKVLYKMGAISVSVLTAAVTVIKPYMA